MRFYLLTYLNHNRYTTCFLFSHMPLERSPRKYIFVCFNISTFFSNFNVKHLHVIDRMKKNPLPWRITNKSDNRACAVWLDHLQWHVSTVKLLQLHLLKNQMHYYVSVIFFNTVRFQSIYKPKYKPHETLHSDTQVIHQYDTYKWPRVH